MSEYLCLYLCYSSYSSFFLFLVDRLPVHICKHVYVILCFSVWICVSLFVTKSAWVCPLIDESVTLGNREDLCVTLWVSMCLFLTRGFVESGKSAFLCLPILLSLYLFTPTLFSEGGTPRPHQTLQIYRCWVAWEKDHKWRQEETEAWLQSFMWSEPRWRCLSIHSVQGA